MNETLGPQDKQNSVSLVITGIFPFLYPEKLCMVVVAKIKTKRNLYFETDSSKIKSRKNTFRFGI